MEQKSKRKYKCRDHIKYRDIYGTIQENYVVATKYDKVAKCYIYLIDTSSCINPCNFEWIREDNIIEKLKE